MRLWSKSAITAFRWDAEIELTQQAIAAANRMQPRPRFFIVCGDLVDGLPGTGADIHEPRGPVETGRLRGRVSPPQHIGSENHDEAGRTHLTRSET